METAPALDRLLDNGKIEFASPRWSVFLFAPVFFFLFLVFFFFRRRAWVELAEGGSQRLRALAGPCRHLWYRCGDDYPERRWLLAGHVGVECG